MASSFLHTTRQSLIFYSTWRRGTLTRNSGNTRNIHSAPSRRRQGNLVINSGISPKTLALPSRRESSPVKRLPTVADRLRIRRHKPSLANNLQDDLRTRRLQPSRSRLSACRRQKCMHSETTLGQSAGLVQPTHIALRGYPPTISG